MRSESVRGWSGGLGVVEGLVVHDLTVVRSFSYLADWSAVRLGVEGILETEEGLEYPTKPLPREAGAGVGHQQ